MQHRFNPDEAPDAAADDVGQVVGMLDAVLLLVGDQELRKAPVLERRKAVLPAPDGVNFVKLLGAGFAFGGESDVILRLHEEQHVVGILPDCFPVGPCADAFGEAKMMTHQPL